MHQCQRILIPNPILSVCVWIKENQGYRNRLFWDWFFLWAEFNNLSFFFGGWGRQPSEQNTYADIEAVYKCLQEKYGAKEEDIVLYGQSVGSGPTIDLATRLPNLRAVVLHSPILSGLRVMYPVKRTYWFDIYKVHLYQY